MAQRTEVVIVGGGHNALVAACLLARAGRDVCVLEARSTVGGAAVSERLFPGVDARLSKYSYLVSLFPAFLADELRLDIPLVTRRISSYTPDPRDPSRGIVIPGDAAADLEYRLAAFTGSEDDARGWRSFYGHIAEFAPAVFASLTEPLPSAQAMRAMVGEDAWTDFFVNPLGEVLGRTFSDDVVRGIVLTDALIGTFSYGADPSLRQNACFLYHVIGNGTGAWNLPLGGMGAVTSALAQRARDLGARIETDRTVRRIASDGSSATVELTDPSGARSQIHASMVLAGCAPRELDRLMARPVLPTPDWAEGAQVKVNMVLSRLPRLRDPDVDPHDAFAGTLHVNESAQQLDAAYATAARGHLPEFLPCEAYCHSLGDRSILGPELADSDAQTLTVFALQTPHLLFRGSVPVVRREQAQRAVLASLSSVLAEPIEDCLMLDRDGRPCIQVSTTADLEVEVGLPAGNIFHTPLDLPYAWRAEDTGTWGVETDFPNIALCGSGARRGGGVSGIPGHNAARYAIEFLARKSSTR